ncbi:MAG: glycosyltransferase [Candidatus Cloacimonetes bacterium]|nr:glycosyltransferase [Candidatus Cloacimonadota bacterium]
MISIILRAKNEMPWLAETLSMLKRQKNQGFELIAVDSGSTDGSYELLQEYQPDILYQIAPESYIPGKVLNAAIAKAKGEIIVFNNADSIPLDEDWLDKLTAPFAEDAELIAVYANQVPRQEAIPLVRKDYERAFGDGKISAQWRHFFSLASSAVRREIILEYPFDEDIQYSEDIEWSWRMKQMGYKIRYLPEARVEHSHNYTLKQIKKRYYGEGKAEGFIYQDLFHKEPAQKSFFRSVWLAFIAEYLRDIVYLVKHKEYKWIVPAKFYRFAQRYYAYLGRKDYATQKAAKGVIAVSCVAYDEGKSGISEYMVSVIRELVKEHKLCLIMHRSDRQSFPIRHENISYYYPPEIVKSALLSMLWHLYILPGIIKRKGWKKLFLPAGNRRLLSKYAVPAVITFHDLSQFHIAGKYDALRLFYIRRVVPHYLKKAPAIFAISENTRQDMLRFYRMQPERIRVNYNGFYLDQGELERVDLAAKYGIRGKYLLYVARIEHPGKNHLNLLKAYERLVPELRAEYSLVLVGGDWNGAEAVHEYHAAMADKDRVHFVGFVPKEQLAAFYNKAALYVFPSLYEGFGLPLLEAFAAGVPVVAANRSSLPEIGAEAAEYFDPEKVKEMAKVIERVLCDPIGQIKMIQLGQERLKLFSWSKHAKLIAASFEEQAGGKPGN